MNQSEPMPADQLSRDGGSVLLSLCMIVRDNESIIGECLESIRPWVDEMIVVDTGSKDRTVEIAEGLGATIHHFPWCDDFSAARNESLKYASGKWLFWMDSDDTIDQANGRKLRQLADQEHPEHILAHVLQVHCPGGPESPADCTVVDHVKVIRNHPSIRFEGRIHEQVLSPIRELGGDVGWTDIFVTHSGSDQSKQGKAGKYERDLRCLKLDLVERPKHPFVLFNLGMTYSDKGDHEEALKWLEQCLEVSATHESHVRKAQALHVHTLHQLDRDQEALEACRTALSDFPNDPELLFRLGIVAHACQRLPEAIEAYQNACSSSSRERYFASLDPSVSGYKARFNLALVYIETGQFDLAELHLRYAIEQAPQFSSAWRKLGETLIAQDRFVTCELLVERMKSCDSLHQDSLFLCGLLKFLSDETEDAWLCIEHAIASHKQEVDLWQTLSRLLFERGRPVDAERALESLVKLHPEDGATYHNLGLIYRLTNQSDKALESFERSLVLRPEAPQTVSALEQVRVDLQQESTSTETAGLASAGD